METKEYAAAGPWIGVKTKDGKEQLPERGKIVLVKGFRDGQKVWDAGYQFCGIWYSTSRFGDMDVTHWAEVTI